MTDSAALSAAVLVSSCHSSSGPNDIAGVKPAWIAPNLEHSIGPDGLFLPALLAANRDSGISAVSAQSLALDYLRTVPTRAGNIAALVDSEHGATVDFESLTICGRTVYASPTLTALTSNASAALRNGLGGQFFMTFCDRAGIPSVLFQLAALTTAESGQSVGFNNDFGIGGIPLSKPDALQSPENAVGVVSTLLDVRVDSVPEAVQDVLVIGPIGANGRPSGLLWRIHLQTPRPVVRVASDTRDTVATVYVVAGYSARSRTAVFAPSRNQLAPFPVIDGTSPSSIDTVLVAVSEPVLFDEIRPAP